MDEVFKTHRAIKTIHYCALVMRESYDAVCCSISLTDILVFGVNKSRPISTEVQYRKVFTAFEKSVHKSLRRHVCVGRRSTLWPTQSDVLPENFFVPLSFADEARKSPKQARHHLHSAFVRVRDRMRWKIVRSSQLGASSAAV